jgi:hypothetical protein
MIRKFTSGVALAAVVCTALSKPALAQSAPATTSPQVRVDVPPPGGGDESSALPETLQNPIADLISVPFQNNTNFNVGPNRLISDATGSDRPIPKCPILHRRAQTVPAMFGSSHASARHGGANVI